MTKGDANKVPVRGVDYPITEANYIGKVAYIIYDPFALYRLSDIPLYIIVTPAFASVLYYYRKKKEAQRKH